MSQPQRSSGMIAHVSKPGTLDEALDRVMLKSDPASPIPTEPLAEVEPGNVRAIRRPKPASVIGELTAAMRPRRNKLQLNSRVDDWILEAIDQTVRDLQGQGYKGITKEAIVIQSIVRGLGLTPPEGWENL